MHTYLKHVPLPLEGRYNVWSPMVKYDLWGCKWLWIIFVTVIISKISRNNFTNREFYYQLVAGSCLLSHVQLSGAPWTSSPPGSSVYGIFQAWMLEWVAISLLLESSRLKDQTRISCVSCIGRQILYNCATWEDPYELTWMLKEHIYGKFLFS